VISRVHSNWRGVSLWRGHHKKVLVVEAVTHVVPAAVAGMEIDHPIRTGEGNAVIPLLRGLQQGDDGS
jgi:hypothetical protein